MASGAMDTGAPSAIAQASSWVKEEPFSSTALTLVAVSIAIEIRES